MRKTFARFALVAVSAVLLFSQNAFSQACLGSPMERGQKLVGGALGFYDGGNTIEFSGGLRMQSPLTIGAVFDIYNLDFGGDGFGFGGNVSYELPGMTELSGCPFGGVHSASIDYGDGIYNSYGYNITTILFGFGVGKKLPLEGDLYIIPSGSGALAIRNTSVDAVGPFADASSTDFDFSFGATLGGQKWFGRFSLGFSTADGSNTVVGIGAGVLIGGR